MQGHRAANPGATSDLRFWFNIEEMRPSRPYQQIFPPNTEWIPPMPRGSNVSAEGRVSWYQYSAGTTAGINPPDTRRLRHWKTFSIYFHNGRVWCYPDDAINNQIGDGQGTAPTRRSRQQYEGYSSDDESSATRTEHGHDRTYEAWSPLTFRQVGRTTLSYATIRGLWSTLICQGPNQHWARSVLPRRYQSQSEASDGQGGMIGEVPILLGLIAGSVEHQYIDAVMQRLQGTYYPGSVFLEDQQQRGLVIRVYRLADDRYEATRGQYRSDAAAALENFEQGHSARWFR